MEFRWAAGIALWTLLSGPIFVGVQHYTAPVPATNAQASGSGWVKAVKPPAARAGLR